MRLPPQCSYMNLIGDFEMSKILIMYMQRFWISPRGLNSKDLN